MHLVLAGRAFFDCELHILALRYRTTSRLRSFSTRVKFESLPRLAICGAVHALIIIHTRSSTEPVACLVRDEITSKPRIFCNTQCQHKSWMSACKTFFTRCVAVSVSPSWFDLMYFEIHVTLSWNVAFHGFCGFPPPLLRADPVTFQG